MSTAGGLVVEDARVSFDGGRTHALDGADLQVPHGQVVALLGPSGCGKSTLLRAIAGVQPLDAGRVAFDGADLGRVPTHKRGFALMFQDGQLFEHLSVADNIAYPLRRQGVSRRDARAQVEPWLELVGLPGAGERRPRTLSGGQQQRVALARALAARPRLLLLDEPLSALDVELRERLADDLHRILHESGMTAVLVTHDPVEAARIADRIVRMRDGRIVDRS